jgi:hypothetical protein
LIKIFAIKAKIFIQFSLIGSFFVCMCVGLGFELKGFTSCHLNHTSSHFALVILEMRCVMNHLLGWSQTLILLISASQVAGIIAVSYWCLAVGSFSFAEVLLYKIQWVCWG